MIDSRRPRRWLGKLLALALSATLAASLALFGCSGASEPVTITVKVPTLSLNTFADPEVSSAFQFLQKAAASFVEQYDGKAEVEVVEFEIADETRALTDTFGTPDSPDVIYEGYFNMGSYIHNGLVVPLDDIISDELRADIPQSYWELSQADGRTYMMPFLHAQNTLSVNPTLMQAAGLENYLTDSDEVQNWTLDQWEEVLSTLRASLPDTAYPMMMYAADNQGDTHIMTLLRSRGCQFFDKNGRFAVNTPEGIEALRWIQDSYAQGYFPSGAESLVIMDNYNLFLQGMLGVYVDNAQQNVNVVESGGFQPVAVNFPAEEGGLATTFVTGFEVLDNGDAARLQVAKDFVQYIYESEFLDYSAGGIPVSNSVAAKYAEELAPLQKYIDNADANWNFTGNNPNWRGVRAVFYQHINDLLFGSVTPEECAAAIDADCNAAIEEGYAVSVLHP